MATVKRLDECKIIVAILRSVYSTHGDVFNTRTLRNTIKHVERRVMSEGTGFLTKTLPKLGKAFDKVLAGESTLDAVKLRLTPQLNSQLPRFLGELFQRVLTPAGSILQTPCIDSIRIIRQICFLFYKYELPYSADQEQLVVSKFVKTEDDLLHSDARVMKMTQHVSDSFIGPRELSHDPMNAIARKARVLLERVFSDFDPTDIIPKHGPGAVATKQRLWNKFLWTNVSEKIRNVYPLHEYFYSCWDHVFDRFDTLQRVTNSDLPARVILVPKDSRGPRLISCEPVDYQWVQQGLGRAIVQHIEAHPCTKYNVFFTDQSPNQRGALLGSSSKRYATLDLNEASDRVSTELVRLLYPAPLLRYLESCRSSATTLPNSSILKLRKFAPMGSSLCFPIMAVTIWAILTAGAPDKDTRESILVYGDDVIVPTAYAEDAMISLESFGLKINRDKSCTKGSFRESCGVDAFQGINVTPVRLRTVWTSSHSPSVFASWVSYANSLNDHRYYEASELIAGVLHDIYGAIPTKDMGLPCPSLSFLSDRASTLKSRFNRALQKRQFKVWTIKSKVTTFDIDGWSMLLRSFTEHRSAPSDVSNDARSKEPSYEDSCFSASSYTRRGAVSLAPRWR